MQDGSEAEPLAAVQELDNVALAGDLASFVQLAEQIDWRSASAEQLARAVQLALHLEAHAYAHHLTKLGAEFFPSDPQVSRMARILAPPRFLGPRPADPSLAANREWLRSEGGSYSGCWVALLDGRLLGHARTAEGLRSIFEEQHDAMLTRVW